MNRKDIILQDAAITRQINLLRFSAGEKKKVLAVLTQLQSDLRLKLLGDLTDFGKARVNKLLKESTAVIDSYYKSIVPSTEVIYKSFRYGGEEGQVLFSSKYRDYAEEYAMVKGAKPSDVREVLITTKRPLFVDMSPREFSDPAVEAKFIKKAIKDGNDVVIFRDASTGDEFYARIRPPATNMLGLAEHEASVTAQSFAAIGLDAALPTEAALKALVNGSLIEGAPSAAWWSKQSDDLAFKFAAQVRQGIAGNETVQQIVRRVIGSPRLGIPGIMETSRRGATALVHTSVQQVANDARLATFKANDDIIKGVQQLSTLDSKTSPVCVAYSGASWDLDGNPINGTTLAFNGGPPRHFNCRSVLVPITLTYKELGIDIPEAPPGTRASDEGQVRSDITMTEWLKGKPPEYVDGLLGPGRSKLFLDGKITLNQLVDGTGRELTLKQLKAL